MITATSITAELHLRHHDDLHNRDIDYRLKSTATAGHFAVFCTLNHQASVVARNKHATTTSMQRFSQRAATVGSRPSYRPDPRILLDLHTWTSNTISMDCN